MSAETPAIPAEVEEEGNKIATERLVFFSDAVIAIAITLLALELPVPDGATTAKAWESFRGDFGDYLAFLISFIVIANAWFAHHWLYRYVQRVHRRVAGINMAWLLTIVVTPFATRVLVGDETAFPMAFTLYAGIQAASQLAFVAIIVTIRRDHLTAAEVPPGTFNRGITRSLAMAIVFLISIPIAYRTHWAFALWALNGYFGRLIGMGLARRRKG
ncbi:TMEM175 family protein [Actinoplanes sp. NPDC051411]|uniref:TMEM175 family protein n=1 Tax=Actinoplanes sp. NPDC051411 TaxID=3155522 RepID=UPI0034194C7E